jgi:hypothetical protein
MGVAARALDFQANALHGGQMGAAREEGDIGPRLGQRRAKSPTDAAGADNRNTHGCSPQLNVLFGLDREADGNAGAAVQDLKG